MNDVKRQETLRPRQAGKRIKAQIGKMLTWGRETVSRYIPLPRVNTEI